jgi:hypothetical protein
VTLRKRFILTKRNSLAALVLLPLLILPCFSQAQTLQQLRNFPPDGAGVPFLLTDGTVMVQGNARNDWRKLTPDQNGSYVNGTWSRLANLPSNYDPYAFASAVLADGRVVIVGGEYNFGVFSFTNLGAIYDPTRDTWTNLPPPTGWAYIGDSPSAMLPNGKFLVGRKFDEQMATLDPVTLQWTAGGSTGKTDWNAEEGWTLLRDGSILTVDVLNNPHSEKYIPSTGQWVSAGSTIANLQGPPEVGCIIYGNGLQYCPPGEIGPAILRTDGTVFATGALHQNAATGHTSVYHPGAQTTDPGTWVPGPDFPNGDSAGDNFAVLLPNGNVLVEGNSSRLYEYDGTTFQPTLFSNGGSMIVLPTGQVLIGGSEVYTSTGTYQQAWAPVPLFLGGSVVRGRSYLIYGQQFNGLSQAAAFGDEFETATNYPLVRITNRATRHVFYARTHNHSTMGVATGKTLVYTHFDVPLATETGASTLEVVANGIPSVAVSITVN